jgi:hypothetical protein
MLFRNVIKIGTVVTLDDQFTCTVRSEVTWNGRLLAGVVMPVLESGSSTCLHKVTA